MEHDQQSAELSPEELALSIDELEEKAAHPLELFFDLVYVFAITQVVSLIAHDLHLSGILRGALLLGLLWWGWVTWTWTLNAVDLEPRLYRIVVMIAMFGVFFMAYSVPTAFEGDAMWLAVGYLVMRLLSMVVMLHGTRDDPVEQKAILVYLPIAMFAPVLVVIGAAVGGEALQWVWLGALVVEVGSTLIAGRQDWHVDPAHFAERHGLIMIIALGEAIIAVGIALGRVDVTAPVPATALLVGLFVACAMWWAYFDRLQGVWEGALRLADDHHAGRLARDVYSLLHYPMIVGIVFIAVAMEEAFLHPDERIEQVVGTLFVVGLGLYLLAMAVATWRCWRTYLYERVICVALIALIVVALDVDAQRTVLYSTLVLLASLCAEYWRFRARIRAAV
jgi:low temperature requirement protein LtrA